MYITSRGPSGGDPSEARHTSNTTNTNTNSTDSNSPNAGEPPSIYNDHACPFCRQIFTSSSLGRHLDLYVREKNPKGPDGVHDLDTIRKMRGRITRRHARVLTAATQDHSENNSRPNLKRASSQPLSPSSHPGPPPAPVRHHQSVDSTLRSFAVAGITDEYGEGFRSTLNRANWQVTGVINNLPPRGTTPSSFQDLHHLSTPRRNPSKLSYDQRQNHADEHDINGAAVVRSRKYCGLCKQRSRKHRNGLYSTLSSSRAISLQFAFRFVSFLYSFLQYNHKSSHTLAIRSSRSEKP